MDTKSKQTDRLREGQTDGGYNINDPSPDGHIMTKLFPL